MLAETTQYREGIKGKGCRGREELTAVDAQPSRAIYVEQSPAAWSHHRLPHGFLPARATARVQSICRNTIRWGVTKGEEPHRNTGERIRPSPSVSHRRQGRSIGRQIPLHCRPSRSMKLGERRTLAAKRPQVGFGLRDGLVGWDAVDHTIAIDRTAHEADNGRHGSSG